MHQAGTGAAHVHGRAETEHGSEEHDQLPSRETVSQDQWGEEEEVRGEFFFWAARGVEGKRREGKRE